MVVVFVYRQSATLLQIVRPHYLVQMHNSETVLVMVPVSVLRDCAWLVLGLSRSFCFVTLVTVGSGADLVATNVSFPRYFVTELVPTLLGSLRVDCFFAACASSARIFLSSFPAASMVFGRSCFKPSGTA